jgi:hypothetical protein
VVKQRPKCLVISRSGFISSIYRRILEPEFTVRVVGLIELSKSILKSSAHVKLVILDFDLQDKLGTNSRIISRVADTEDIRLLVLTSHSLQLKMIKSVLKAKNTDGRIRIVEGFAKYIQGPYFVFRSKQKILRVGALRAE